MFAEWYKPDCSLEYPLHGSGAVVDALVRGLQKFGGRLSLRSHVEKIVVENNRAIGVELKNGQVGIFDPLSDNEMLPQRFFCTQGIILFAAVYTC